MDMRVKSPQTKVPDTHRRIGCVSVLLVLLVAPVHDWLLSRLYGLKFKVGGPLLVPCKICKMVFGMGASFR
jgi:hypothetical protein